METLVDPGTVLAGVATTMGLAYVNAKLALGHDLRQYRANRSFGKRLGKQLEKLGDEVTIYRILELADSSANALWFENRTWTYAELIREVDQLAWVFQSRGVMAGNFVAIFMTNCPEMVIAMYALAKLGAVSAMINATLRRDTLLHCINIADAMMIVSSPDLVGFTGEIDSTVDKTFTRMCLNFGTFDNILPLPKEKSEDVIYISQHNISQMPSPIQFERPKRRPQDTGALIYTSGVTGKPKAVAVKNYSFVLVSLPVPDDLNNPKRYFPLRTYSSLPLFHGTCLFAGMCYSAGTSGTFCLARKFSASRFSQELTESRATRTLYVGELCRYLLAAPPSKYDKAHKCIVAGGNGLQKDIWEKFKRRYNIPEIREVYRSTEGVTKFDNSGQGIAGAGKVGFSGPLGRYLEDVTYLVRYDHDKEDLYRDPKTGFCVLAKQGEPGEAIGRVRSMTFYSEYHQNPEATQLKLVKNVFRKGDLFQRSGDLLLRDTDGWVQFHDRIGDTFRWKGENVSAGEVRGFISEMPNVADAVVYGVKLQGYDGQAGAAGISLEDNSRGAEDTCITALYSYLVSRGVPLYAMPRLVRFIEQVATGATFKHAKEVVRSRPWQPSLNDTDGDHLYWLNGKTYQKLDDQSWTAIELAKAKL